MGHYYTVVSNVDKHLSLPRRGLTLHESQPQAAAVSSVLYMNDNRQEFQPSLGHAKQILKGAARKEFSK